MNRVSNIPAMTIAVVDDDAAILDSVALALSLQGWQAHTYTTGEAFLADFDIHRPDCLILDPHLPGMNGVDVVRAMIKDNTYIPIVGFTAKPNSPIAIDVTNAGAHIMLTKPVTFEALVGHIQAAINGSGDG